MAQADVEKLKLDLNRRMDGAMDTLKREYAEDTSRVYPVRFFCSGDPYRFWNLFDTSFHLVCPGEGGTLFLAGTDRLGRDVLSRVIYGTRISLTIGLLGLAGVGAVVLKQMRGGTHQTIAASIAQSRFEQFEGDPCATIVGGTATVRGMTETWTVAAVGLRAKTIRDTVSYVGTKGTRKVGIHTVVACTQ